MLPKKKIVLLQNNIGVFAVPFSATITHGTGPYNVNYPTAGTIYGYENTELRGKLGDISIDAIADLNIAYVKSQVTNYGSRISIYIGIDGVVDLEQRYSSIEVGGQTFSMLDFDRSVEETTEGVFRTYYSVLVRSSDETDIATKAIAANDVLKGTGNQSAFRLLGPKLQLDPFETRITIGTYDFTYFGTTRYSGYQTGLMGSASNLNLPTGHTLRSAYVLHYPDNDPLTSTVTFTLEFEEMFDLLKYYKKIYINGVKLLLSDFTDGSGSSGVARYTINARTLIGDRTIYDTFVNNAVGIVPIRFER